MNISTQYLDKPQFHKLQCLCLIQDSQDHSHKFWSFALFLLHKTLSTHHSLSTDPTLCKKWVTFNFTLQIVFDKPGQGLVLQFWVSEAEPVHPGPLSQFLVLVNVPPPHVDEQVVETLVDQSAQTVFRNIFLVFLLLCDTFMPNTWARIC